MRAAYEDAAASLVATVERIEPHQWDLPGLGEWNVRELAAHTLRGFTTIEMYMQAEPTVDRVLTDAVEYYRTALADPAVHNRVAERARHAAAQFTDPLGEIQATAQRVLALVASTADDDTINTPAGQMMFVDYLVTRAAEVALHTLDLQRATGQSLTLRGEAAPVVVALMAAMAEPIGLLLALTGRGVLPADFNVLR